MTYATIDYRVCPPARPHHGRIVDRAVDLLIVVVVVGFDLLIVDVAGGVDLLIV